MGLEFEVLKFLEREETLDMQLGRSKVVGGDRDSGGYCSSTQSKCLLPVLGKELVE